jgi:hypothetical protein
VIFLPDVPSRASPSLVRPLAPLPLRLPPETRANDGYFRTKRLNWPLELDIMIRNGPIVAHGSGNPRWRAFLANGFVSRAWLANLYSWRLLLYGYRQG